MKKLKFLIPAFLSVILTTQTHAVTGVNPSGVNVNHSAASTVFLTFQDLDPNEISTEAFWCGEVTSTGVSTSNPCVAGTLFGHLPQNLDRSTASTAGTFSNLTDIMSIPASVARRAFQDAINGNNSDFFYVRHFTGGAGGDRWVTVTCRMAGGGARSPLALMDVRIGFLGKKETKSPVYLLERGKVPARLAARILYNGTGRLKGRWEVKLPGDPEPSTEDLLTEATLPVNKRGTQRRYTVLGNFDIFLNPTGKAVIPGPDPDKLPNTTDGMYKILLRIEATRDKEGNSNTGAGTVVSGGVAGFPMPVLRYYVGSPEALQKVKQNITLGELQLMLPLNDSAVASANPLEFSWVGVQGAQIYRLEIRDNDLLVNSAIVPAGQLSYMAPPWIHEHKGKTLTWSVSAIDRDGEVVAKSYDRQFTVR